MGVLESTGNKLIVLFLIDVVVLIFNSSLAPQVMGGNEKNTGAIDEILIWEANIIIIIIMDIIIIVVIRQFRRAGRPWTKSWQCQGLTMLSQKLISILSQMAPASQNQPNLLNIKCVKYIWLYIETRGTKMMFDNDYDHRWHKDCRSSFEGTIALSRPAAVTQANDKAGLTEVSQSNLRQHCVWYVLCLS